VFDETSTEYSTWATVSGGGPGQTMSMTPGGTTHATSQSNAVLAVTESPRTTLQAANTTTENTQIPASRLRRLMNMTQRYAHIETRPVHN
jgi:hypothetical protein